jgi:hypothetical protein
MALTVKQIDSAKPKDKLYKLRDVDVLICLNYFCSHIKKAAH